MNEWVPRSRVKPPTLRLSFHAPQVETIESIHFIKQKIPDVKTILWISNISFGLPAAALEIVSSVLVYYCIATGLDPAIVNSESLERFARIPEEERRLAEAFLFNAPAVNVTADHPHAPLLEPVPED